MAHPQAGVGTGPPVSGLDAGGAAAAGWSAAPELVAPLAALAIVYAVGWWRLASRGARPGGRPRAAAGLVGLSAAAIALLSPLAALAHELFVAHMAQHMLLIAVAAPLILLGNPFPAVLWAIPRPARAALGRLLVGGSPLRRGWERLTSVAVAGPVYAAVLWIWHYPLAYEAALGSEWVHHAEHLAFLAAAVLFWWPVIGPAPRPRRPPSHGLRIAHVLLAALHGSLLALLLSVFPRVLYASYARGAEARSLAPLADQAWGGVVMWAAGGAVDMLAILVLVWRLLAAGERDAGSARRQPAQSATNTFMSRGDAACRLPQNTSVAPSRENIGNEANDSPYVTRSRPEPSRFTR
jgi:cytochrome c oxidase assembly factor CtaG